MSSPSCGHVMHVSSQAVTEHSRSMENMIFAVQWYVEWDLLNFMTLIDNQLGSLK